MRAVLPLKPKAGTPSGTGPPFLDRDERSGEHTTMRDVKADSPAVKAICVRRPEVWLLKIRCPYCAQTHTHGGGSGARPYGGHRVAHCQNPPPACQGYEIQVGS